MHVRRIKLQNSSIYVNIVCLDLNCLNAGILCCGYACNTVHSIVCVCVCAQCAAGEMMRPVREHNKYEYCMRRNFQILFFTSLKNRRGKKTSSKIANMSMLAKEKAMNSQFIVQF